MDSCKFDNRVNFSKLYILSCLSKTTDVFLLWKHSALGIYMDIIEKITCLEGKYFSDEIFNQQILKCEITVVLSRGRYSQSISLNLICIFLYPQVNIPFEKLSSFWGVYLAWLLLIVYLTAWISLLQCLLSILCKFFIIKSQFSWWHYWNVLFL